MTHDYHEGHPGYHPDQLLKDGCTECKFRSEHLHVALAHMDTRLFAVAWVRAIDFEMGRLDNVSQAEAPLLRAIWTTASLATVFAHTSREANALADKHGLWGRAATEAHAQLWLDQQAAYRSLARTENARMREALGPEAPQRPVSTRCELGAHGGCMQGAWCLCPCHISEGR